VRPVWTGSIGLQEADGRASELLVIVEILVGEGQPVDPPPPTGLASPSSTRGIPGVHSALPSASAASQQHHLPGSELHSAELETEEVGPGAQGPARAVPAVEE
jgi:hypothetical protein